MRALLVKLVEVFAVTFCGTVVWAWQVDINGTENIDDLGAAVTMDERGDVISAGTLQMEPRLGDFTMVKLDRTRRMERWLYVADGTPSGNDRARAVTTDFRGDVISAGALRIEDQRVNDFTVVKLDRTRGVERWRYVVDGTASALAVATDFRGDVIASGWLFNSGTGQDFFVVKLDGRTGAERWRYLLPGYLDGDDQALAVAVDGAGNVIAAGYIAQEGSGEDFTVLKLAGSTGELLWRYSLAGTADYAPDAANTVTLDNAGNVLAAGRILNNQSFFDFVVVKLSAGRGTQLWRYVLDGSASEGSFDEASTVKTDARGDVIVAGVTHNATTVLDYFDFTVVKLNGSNGAERWRRILDTVSGPADAAGLAVDPWGNVVAAGRPLHFRSGRPVPVSSDFAVVKLDGNNGVSRWRKVIKGHFGEAFEGAQAVRPTPGATYLPSATPKRRKHTRTLRW